MGAALTQKHRDFDVRILPARQRRFRPCNWSPTLSPSEGSLCRTRRY